MRFKHLPVHSALDTTKNFEQLQGLFKEDETVAMAYRSSAQEIVAAKTEQVKVDKVIKQSASLFDTTNGWYVVPFEGYYIVEGQVALEIGASTGGAFAQINLSGVEKARGTRVNALKETFIYVTVSTIIFCKAGEHIELIASNQTASNCKLEIKESNNQLCVAAAGSTGLTGPQGPAGAAGGGSLGETTVATMYRAEVVTLEVGLQKVPIEKALFDPGSNFDKANNRYKVPSDGYYHCDGSIRWLATDKVGSVYIYVNGTRELDGSATFAPEGEKPTVGINVSGIVKVKTGDTIELWSYHEKEPRELSEYGRQQNRLTVVRVA